MLAILRILGGLSSHAAATTTTTVTTTRHTSPHPHALPLPLPSQDLCEAETLGAVVEFLENDKYVYLGGNYYWLTQVPRRRLSCRALLLLRLLLWMCVGCSDSQCRM